MSTLPWWRQARWRAAAFLAVAAALNYADRSALAAVLPALREEFQLSDFQLGLLGSLFLWGYALGSPAAGWLADRRSRRALVVLSLALWSGVTALMGVAPGFAALAALRAGLGLAECLYLPAATALLADHHGPATRARAMSVHSLGLNFGVVLGGTFAGYLAQRFGWRTGFWVLGGLGLVLAGLARRQLPAAPGPAATPVPAESPTLGEVARYLLGVPSYQVLLAKAMLAGVGVWIFLNWLPLYFRETFHLSLAEAGFAGTFMLQVATMLGLAAGGWISDRLALEGARRRMALQGVSYLLAAPFLLLFLLRPGFFTIAAAVAAFSFFRGLGQANENPTLCEVVPLRYRSTAIGVMNTAATAAGGAGVLLAGWLKGACGLDAIFAGLAALFVLAGAALLVAYSRWMPRDLARAQAAGAAGP